MPQQVPTVPASELPDDAVVLDVREDDEWVHGHIDGADHIRPLVAKWWMPDAVEFIDEVPKTSVGKFSKKDLRAKFAEYELPS